MSLFDLAADVQSKTERFDRARQGKELAEDLRERLQQITAITDRASNLQRSRDVVAVAVPALKLPKKSLRLRVKSIERLEAAVVSDIKKLTERNALDPSVFYEALGEAEAVVLDAWRKFAKPPREVAIGALEGDPDADQLRSLRQQLDARAKQVPGSETDIAEVVRLKEEIGELGDRLLAAGYDEEVLRFLEQARGPRGVALGEVLASPKLAQWLQDKKHTAALRLVHENVLNQRNSFRP
ncbi:MAG: hypothetical protein J0M04_19915 [Verrucomicrobia bacterium]|nr:hypothetical protein [Verrucomicrobiota bacterium]